MWIPPLRCMCIVYPSESSPPGPNHDKRAKSKSIPGPDTVQGSVFTPQHLATMASLTNETLDPPRGVRLLVGKTSFTRLDDDETISSATSFL